MAKRKYLDTAHTYPFSYCSETKAKGQPVERTRKWIEAENSGEVFAEVKVDFSHYVAIIGEAAQIALAIKVGKEQERDESIEEGYQSQRMKRLLGLINSSGSCWGVNKVLQSIGIYFAGVLFYRKRYTQRQENKTPSFLLSRILAP